LAVRRGRLGVTAVTADQRVVCATVGRQRERQLVAAELTVLDAG
jgi:hypothetical protein